MDFNNTLVLGPTVDPQFTLNSSYIRENSQYSYTVEAVNSINVSNGIKARNLTTTDVELAMVRVMCTSVIVNCTFILGSQSKGCSVELSPVETLNITRTKDSNTVQEEMVVPDITVVEEILVYDWEEDGSIGVLPVPTHVDSSCSSTTPTTAASENLTSGNGNFLFIILITVGSGGGMLIVVLCMLIAITCCCIVSHRKNGEYWTCAC